MPRSRILALLAAKGDATFRFTPDDPLVLSDFGVCSHCLIPGLGFEAS